MREISLPTLQAMLAQETERVFLHCVTIEHPGLATPVRRVADHQALTRAAGEFLPYPFTIALPADTEDRLPQVRLIVDNVSRELVETIRTLDGDVMITLEVVTAPTPDVVEAGPFEFTLLEARGRELVIECTLGFEDVLNEPYPAVSFTPRTAPGLF